MDVRELVDRLLETVNGNQAEAARQLRRSETTISRWANGRNGIDYESALRIARMTGLPPRQVLEAAGLDAELYPAQATDADDDADLSARKFAGALRGVPRRFWAVVVDASVTLANAYGSAPVDADELTPRPSGRGTVSESAKPPISNPKGRANRRSKASDTDLPRRYEPVFALLGIS